ncbi:MAG: hypothetical protein H3C35_10960 [Bacteroidetes bacterium]|nr:hypothetical protein [Bacteroidota bacterium]
MKQIIFFLLLSSIVTVNAQVKRLQQKSDDVFEELETGNLTLRFFDAVTGKEIPNASVNIENVGEGITDDEGKIVFPPPEEDGEYMVSFRASGYVPTDFPIEIMAGTLFFNRASISPQLDIKFVRIVVDWDKQPNDLDAHFVKQNDYHLSYRNMRVLADGTGMLDRDAMQGYGPETITVKEISSQSVYNYFIEDYTNRSHKGSKALSNSKATVKVYGDGKLLKVISIPREKSGTIWKVFSIMNGQVREINQLSNN